MGSSPTLYREIGSVPQKTPADYKDLDECLWLKQVPASDNGWGMFVDMLAYKAERKGKWLVKVNCWFPLSKTCCYCGHIHKGHIHKELTLNDRTYVCPKCGHVMDRDKQAAINILNETIRILHNAA